jgi:hypothetical protein
MKPIPPDPQRLAKWQRWQRQIEHELISLLGSRQIYKSYGEIVTKNEAVQKGGPLFHNWIVDNYVTYVAMAIRRQADTDSDSVSLARLISDIRDHPESMTRATHVAFYKNFIIEGYGDQMFTEHAGPGDFMDPTIAKKDLAELQEVSRSVNQLASRTIAHKSTRAVPKLTFNDIDACIEAIKKIAQKYILLLSAAHNVLEPVMDDWQTIFTMKWIK